MSDNGNNSAADEAADPALLPTAAPVTNHGVSDSGDLPPDVTVTARSSPHARARASKGLRGMQLAHYLVQDEIGRGGMGVVYRAHDLALDRLVAIKVLSGDFSEASGHRARFYREARAQALVNHPNVCHIYYVGEEHGHLFFAMELVDGQSVSDLIKERGTVPAPRALELIRQAALGLREAHKHGIVHRDVKPSNLMLDRHGVVKVMDFGIAAHADHAVQTELGETVTVEQTSIAGTPLFSAPEQLLGQAIDHRADIYALGATLHQLLAGSAPFDAATVDALTELHRSESRPRFERRVLGQRDLVLLDELTDRMMAKKPADRFETYDELLESIEFAEPSSSRPARVGIRLLAFAIDAMFVLLLGSLAELVVPEPVTGPLLAGIAAGYGILLLARFGTTLGRWLLGIEVTSASPGDGIGLQAAAVRWLWQVGPLVLLIVLKQVADMQGGTPLRIAGVVGVGGILLLNVLHVAVASFRSSAARAFWDRRAGTQVRYLSVRGVGDSESE